MTPHSRDAQLEKIPHPIPYLLVRDVGLGNEKEKPTWMRTKPEMFLLESKDWQKSER